MTRGRVEVAHRALKTDGGVGQGQCWHPTAPLRAVQTQVWTYALCALAGHRAWGYADHPPRRAATRCRGLQQALGLRPACPQTTGTWAEKEAWLHHLDALLAA